MSKYDSEYFFIRKPKNNAALPFLSPDNDTADRNFRFEPQLAGAAPLIFNNTWVGENKKNGTKSVVVDVMFEGDDLVVHARIRDKLLLLNIPEVYIHRAIYIDDIGNRHEDFWYLTFPNRLDCWDRDYSDYERDDPPVRLGGFEMYQIYEYSFDSEVLDKLELKDRLLFKMGGSLDGFIVCHVSIASIFSGGPVGTVELTQISEY